jgi:hypothetical protein
LRLLPCPAVPHAVCGVQWKWLAGIGWKWLRHTGGMCFLYTVAGQRHNQYRVRARTSTALDACSACLSTCGTHMSNILVHTTYWSYATQDAAQAAPALGGRGRMQAAASSPPGALAYNTYTSDCNVMLNHCEMHAPSLCNMHDNIRPPLLAWCLLPSLLPWGRSLGASLVAGACPFPAEAADPLVLPRPGLPVQPAAGRHSSCCPDAANSSPLQPNSPK